MMIPINLLHAFQLENYDIVRFLRFAYSRFWFWFVGSKRQHLVWTKKAVGIFVLADAIFILGLLLGYYIFWFSCWFLFVLVGDLILFPIFFIVWCFIMKPVEYLLEYRIINKAKNKVKANKQLNIVWITWSYGKTSTKEFLKVLLKDSFDVIAPIGTHNTLLWVSDFIIKELKPTTQIMIVEMGAYVPGDIRKLCDIAQPHFALITWITKQHLERFKSIESIISTKFEITQKLTKNDILFVDWENKYIQEWLSKYCVNTAYQIEKIWKISVEYLPDFSWISFTYKWEKYETRLLWRHNAKNLSLAIEVALKCWVPSSILKEKIKNIPFVPHRLELIYNDATWVYVIDDSFNGNIDGVKSTMDILKNTPFKWKRIYLTPGLVELWKESDSIHFDIWCNLVGCVDKVILINTPWTQKIREWLISKWFNKDNIIIFEYSEDAHKSVWRYASRWDVIVFQNDLTDNYF